VVEVSGFGWRYVSAVTVVVGLPAWLCIIWCPCPISFRKISLGARAIKNVT